MKSILIASILIAAGLISVACSTVKEQKRDPYGLNELQNQVELCYIIGVQYDDFESFMKEQGIRTFGQGGEFYIVTVSKSKKEKALELIQRHDLQERFDINLNILHPSSAIQSEVSTPFASIAHSLRLLYVREIE